MIVSASPGLGASLAQGEVTPDRYDFDQSGRSLSVTPGRRDQDGGCAHRAAKRSVASAPSKPCLTEVQAVELGVMLRRIEDLMGIAVEIEWALDDSGFKLLQARPLHLQPPVVPDAAWIHRTRLNGHPAGVGWGTGPACVINCECELS